MSSYPGNPKHQKACCVGSVDPSQSNVATIKQNNIVMVMCGGGGPSSLSILGETFNFEVNEYGDLTVNGQVMEASELENGIKMYTFKDQEIN